MLCLDLLSPRSPHGEQNQPCPPRRRSTASRPAPVTSAGGIESGSISAFTLLTAGQQLGVRRHTSFEQGQGNRSEVHMVDDSAQPADGASTGHERIAGRGPGVGSVEVQQHQHSRGLSQVVDAGDGLLAAVAPLSRCTADPIQSTSCGMVRSSVSTPSRGRLRATLIRLVGPHAGRAHALDSRSLIQLSFSCRGTRKSSSMVSDGLRRMNPAPSTGTAVASAGSSSISAVGQHILVRQVRADE